MMAIYFDVWDPNGESAETAYHVEADTPEIAAEMYAEDDTDGALEGIYSGRGHVLHVHNLAGFVTRVRVVVDYEPTYTATIDQEPTT